MAPELTLTQGVVDNDCTAGTPNIEYNMRILARLDGNPGLSAIYGTDSRTDFKISIEADCNFVILSFGDLTV